MIGSLPTLGAKISNKIWLRKRWKFTLLLFPTSSRHLLRPGKWKWRQLAKLLSQLLVRHKPTTILVVIMIAAILGLLDLETWAYLSLSLGGPRTPRSTISIWNLFPEPRRW